MAAHTAGLHPLNYRQQFGQVHTTSPDESLVSCTYNQSLQSTPPRFGRDAMGGYNGYLGALAEDRQFGGG